MTLTILRLAVDPGGRLHASLQTEPEYPPPLHFRGESPAVFHPPESSVSLPHPLMGLVVERSRDPHTAAGPPGESIRAVHPRVEQFAAGLGSGGAHRVEIDVDRPDAALSLAFARLCDFGAGVPLVLRRAVGPASPQDRPLFIATQSFTSRPEGWFEGLFDAHARSARAELGAVGWGERWSNSRVVHVVLGAPAPGIGYFVREPWRPQLLVVEVEGRPWSAAEICEVVRQSLDADLDAVLIVRAGADHGEAQAVFQAFYRAILHDKPLDACLSIAGPQDAVLGLRPGAELSLSLTRGLASLLTPRLVARTLESTFTPISSAPETPLGARVKSVVDARMRSAEEQLIALSRTPFDHELTALREVVDARRSFEALATGRHEATELLGDEERLRDAAARLTNVWIEDGAGHTRPSGTPLRLGAEHVLGVDVGPRREGATSARFPGEKLAAFFEADGEVTLDVVLFADPEELELRGEPVRQLRVPRFGKSDALRFTLVPRRAGASAARVSLYHRGTLIQSVRCAFWVAAEGAEHPPIEIRETLGSRLDYRATSDPAALGDLPPPSVSLFINDTGEGDHRIGAYAPGAAPVVTPRIAGTRLSAQAEVLRAALQGIQGTANHYYYGDALSAADKVDVDERLRRLVVLAQASYPVYQSLLAPLERPAAIELNRRLRAPGLVSIARCDTTAPTLPWAALYDYPIDPQSPQLAVCPKLEAFAVQSAAAGAAGTPPAAVPDLLADPVACRAAADCPLGDPTRARTTVCPFGFWGIRHQIEQPIHGVTSDADVANPSVQLAIGDTGARVAVCVDAVLGQDGADHAGEIRDEVQHLEPAAAVAVKTNAGPVLGALREGGASIFYLYCHGEVLQPWRTFGLRFGPGAGAADFIMPANIDIFEVDWKPQALVVLNGCESVALSPELIQGFIDVLRQVGALGIVGTEIKVFNLLARPFGADLVKGLLGRASLGEVFVALRRARLRQLNPLGLAFTFHGPAELHLHPPTGCPRCAHTPAKPTAGIVTD